MQKSSQPGFPFNHIRTESRLNHQPLLFVKASSPQKIGLSSNSLYLCDEIFEVCILRRRKGLAMLFLVPLSLID